jgi:tight adherence protein C
VEGVGLIALIGFVVITVVGGIGYGLYALANPTRTASDRLRELSQGTDLETPMTDLVGTSDPSNPLIEQLGKFAAPTTEEDRNRQREMLTQAGWRSRRSLEMFNAIRVTCAISFPILGTVPLSMMGGFLWTAFGILGLAVAGYFGPLLLVQNQVNKRKSDLLKVFPDAMDLMVSSVEAGLGLDAAFRRVAAELETASPDLAREFQLVNHEISAGVPRVQALRHLEMRTGLEEVRSLVNMLTQAERFGSSIAKSLRVHSKGTRQKRMSKAEEEAAKVSPKLTVVMIIFLLPVLIAILMSPAMLRVADALN